MIQRILNSKNFLAVVLAKLTPESAGRMVVREDKVQIGIPVRFSSR